MRPRKFGRRSPWRRRGRVRRRRPGRGSSELTYQRFDQPVGRGSGVAFFAASAAQFDRHREPADVARGERGGLAVLHPEVAVLRRRAAGRHRRRAGCGGSGPEIGGSWATDAEGDVVDGRLTRAAHRCVAGTGAKAVPVGSARPAASRTSSARSPAARVRGTRTTNERGDGVDGRRQRGEHGAAAVEHAGAAGC